VLAAWQTVLNAPDWKPVRWGVVALIALQVLGLNALAWRERSALNAQQASLQSILQTTFPSVTLVIDAPLQMQREVDALQQKSGSASSTDLEPLLAALAGVLPAGQTPQQIHYANHALRVQGVTFDSHAPGMARLSAQGLNLRQDGNDTWVLQAEGMK
jgi:general secretion pathway protein L